MSDNGSKTRVLHITMRWGEGRGGVKQFILNAVNALDSERYEQSVLSVGPVTGGDLGLDLHGPVVTRGDSLSLVLAAPRLERAIRSLTPDAVHIHCNNGLGMLYAEAARRAGCVVRVCHSHNTAVEDGCAVKRIANSVLKRRFSSAPTLRVACSELAGAYLFGDEPFEVVRNGIDVESFAFDPCARRDVRSRYGIDDNASWDTLARGFRLRTPGSLLIWCVFWLIEASTLTLCSWGRARRLLPSTITQLIVGCLNASTSLVPLVILGDTTARWMHLSCRLFMRVFPSRSLRLRQTGCPASPRRWFLGSRMSLDWFHSCLSARVLRGGRSGLQALQKRGPYETGLTLQIIAGL